MEIDLINQPLNGSPVEPFPLSWVTGQHLQVFQIPLPLKGVWFPYGIVPAGWTLNQLVDFLEHQGVHPVVVRGWTQEAVHYLPKRGWCCWQVGMEGRLLLTESPVLAKNTRHAIRRGRKSAYFFRWPDATQLPHELQHLIAQAAIARHPRLQWLFRQPPDPALRLYVAGNGNNWWAAMAVSTNRPGWVQAEWMVRHRNAPYGVLDALVHFVLQEERLSGGRVFTFGEVPFLQVNNARRKARMIIRASALGLQGAYNYFGLFHFKNKYVTHWQPVYLCGFPQLNLTQVAGLAWHSRALRLWQRGMWLHLRSKTQQALVHGVMSSLFTILPFLPL